MAAPGMRRMPLVINGELVYRDVPFAAAAGGGAGGAVRRPTAAAAAAAATSGRGVGGRHAGGAADDEDEAEWDPLLAEEGGKRSTGRQLLTRAAVYLKSFLTPKFIGGFIAWCIGFKLCESFIELYIVLTILALMLLNTRPRKPGEMSAYSVFNENFQSLPGELRAEHFEQQLGYGNAAAAGGRPQAGPVPSGGRRLDEGESDDDDELQRALQASLNESVGTTKKRGAK